jgi:hypothetical protein
MMSSCSPSGMQVRRVRHRHQWSASGRHPRSLPYSVATGSRPAQRRRPVRAVAVRVATHTLTHTTPAPPTRSTTRTALPPSGPWTTSEYRMQRISPAGLGSSPPRQSSPCAPLGRKTPPLGRALRWGKPLGIWIRRHTVRCVLVGAQPTPARRRASRPTTGILPQVCFLHVPAAPCHLGTMCHNSTWRHHCEDTMVPVQSPAPLLCW